MKKKTGIFGSDKSPTLPSISHDLSLKGKFGKYILIEKLGEGGTGVVYKVSHPTLNAYFALKIVLSSKVGKESISRFEREARVAFKLKHPNIVHVHDVGVQDETHYILMDYIAGKELGKLIKESRVWPRRALEIILQIARALQYSHDQGIIHRDIKPSNILIMEKEGKEIPYLTDFGLALVIEEEGLTRTGQIMGTPQYMSPEQARGINKLDGRSDIYSLGVVLYEMLSGKRVVESEHIMAIIYIILHQDPHPLSKYVQGISRDVEAITMKCLEKEPYRRYQTAGELADDIERYIRGEAVFARSPGLMYNIWRKMKRVWKAVTFITALIIVAIGIVIWERKDTPEHSKMQISSLVQQAEVLENSGNLKKAANIYLAMLELDRNYKEAKEALTQVKKRMQEKASNLEKEENLRESKKIYEDIVEIDKENKDAIEGIKRIRNKIEVEWNNAKELGEKKEFVKAFELCRKLIAWEPTEGHSNHIVELIRTQYECRKLARRYYDTATEIWNTRLNETELEKCKKLFEKAIEIDPTFADAHFRAGRVAHRLFKFAEAKDHYNESLKVDPDFKAAKYYLDAIKFSMAKEIEIKKASDVIPKFIKENKEYTEIVLENKDPYFILEKVQSLIFAFIVLMEDKEKWREISNTYNNIHNKLIQYCNKVIEVYPTFTEAYFLRAQLNSYFLYIQDKMPLKYYSALHPKSLNQALKDCYHGIYLDPFRVEFYILRGLIFSSISAYELAEKDYTMALNLKQELLKYTFYRKRAMCYMAMCSFNLAQEDLNQSIKMSREELNQKDERTARLSLSEQAYSLIWRAALKAALKNDNEGAAQDLKDYKALSFEINFDVLNIKNPNSLVEALVYFFIEDSTDKAQDNLKIFLDTNISYIKPIKLYIYTLTKRENPETFLQNTSLFLKSIPNLFCVDPNIKRCRKEHFEFIFSLENTIISLIGGLYNIEDEFSVIFSTFFDSWQKNPLPEKKRETINKFFQEECSPLTLDLFLRFINYISESINIRRLLLLDELPLASLYYRRAIDYYIRGEYENVRVDLEAALELEPNYMEAHYGLSTLYSVLSEKDPSYRKLAIYHLKRAIMNGWGHFEDYTLRDDDFKSLIMEQKSDFDQLCSLSKKMQEKKRFIQNFHQDFIKNIQELIAEGKIVEALKILYNPVTEFPIELKEIIEETEKKAIDYFAVNIAGKEKGLALYKKVEKLLGSKGTTLWNMAKHSINNK